ncbi:hemagglutinin-neuraminidase [Avian metaavulavirus 22]|uniref:Hemagglutinin-neuraminidase n=1 Tax=Avian metaavulavirus 22 TaxID=2843746 RepID=A0AA95BGX7_9MONO|nr:hemagglutinin-neuraminidase [Avian metaavulavirus 22]
MDSHIPAKNTWRTVYRVVTILLDIVIIVLAIISLVSLGLKPGEKILTGVNDSVHAELGMMRPALLDIDSKVSTIYRYNLINLPLQLDDIQTAIVSSSRQLADTINSFLAINGSSAVLYTTSPEFSNGFNKELYPNFNQTRDSISIGQLVEFTNFIPTPTTKPGCIRIPTFAAGQSHWCYSHNIIASGCQDHSTSSQYIAMGVIIINQQQSPDFRTTTSITLSDNKNRKSCSVGVSEYGCDLLCSVVTETENDDYKSEPPTDMIYGRLFLNGTYSEVDLPVSTLFSEWVANYPGVGSGVVYRRKMYFPIYGGIKISSNLGNYLSHFYYIPQVPTVNCTDSDEIQITNAKASYSPPKVAPNLWGQALLACNISVNLPSSCRLLVFNTSSMMMGAEGRIYNINEQYYFYQRSSSYWPVGLIYRLEMTSLDSMTDSGIINTTPIPFEKFPRPASQAGVCSIPSVCPRVCQTGVYQDIWVLSQPSVEMNTTAIGIYLNSAVGRTNPKIGVANTLSWIDAVQLFQPTTPASYSTTTCFKNTARDISYCLSILELSDSLLGSWRIAPLLYNLTLVPSS